MQQTLMDTCAPGQKSIQELWQIPDFSNNNNVQCNWDQHTPVQYPNKVDAKITFFARDLVRSFCISTKPARKIARAHRCLTSWSLTPTPHPCVPRHQSRDKASCFAGPTQMLLVLIATDIPLRVPRASTPSLRRRPTSLPGRHPC
eukprot:2301772-Rhodomonas_salina.1